MIHRIETVLILGASGTIGSLVGGLLAQAGAKVYFLSRTVEGAKQGIQRAFKQARSEVIGKNIRYGDYASLLEQASAEADWIVECVTEKADAKHQLYQRIDSCRSSNSIVSSTTSSLPIQLLVEGRSLDFREHFLSTHFYNPPARMLACEIASLSETRRDVVKYMESFLREVLRRVVIPTRNTAAFAGNRIAFLLFNQITALAIEHGIEVMDYLAGPYTGRVMPPLATIDLVGLDIHQSIIRSLQENTNDPMHSLLELPDYVNSIIEKGCLGDKTPQMGGFYKKVERGTMYLNPNTCEYIPAIRPHFVFVEQAKGLIHLGKYREAFRLIKDAHGPEADLLRGILCTYVAYCYSLVGEVTDAEYGIDAIDRVMSHGFNWAPPSLVVQLFGGKEPTAELLEKNGFAVPAFLKDGPDPSEYFFNSGKYFTA